MSNEVVKIVADNKTIELKASATRLMFNNFLSGLAWGVGSVVGATLVVSVLLYLIGLLDTAPFIGDFISEILKNIDTVKN